MTIEERLAILESAVVQLAAECKSLKEIAVHSHPLAKVRQASLAGQEEAIFAAVSAEFSVPVVRIKGKLRERHTALARHLVCLLLRRRLELSYPEIGHVMGDLDHTSAMYRCKRAEAMIAASQMLAQRVAAIEMALDATQKVA